MSWEKYKNDVCSRSFGINTVLHFTQFYEIIKYVLPLTVYRSMLGSIEQFKVCNCVYIDSLGALALVIIEGGYLSHPRIGIASRKREGREGGSFFPFFRSFVRFLPSFPLHPIPGGREGEGCS